MRNFDAGNPNFTARIIIFFLSVGALAGIKFPGDPALVAENVTNALSGGGYIAVLGVLATSVIMPIINFIRSKPSKNFREVFFNLVGSANFWIYLGSFVLGIMVLLGIEIPEATSEQAVGAIFEKDWIGLILIAATNILDPIIRYFRDRKKEAELLS
ncbi:MAG: hypothetical protein ACRC1D_09390 [Culicoidibacterales bacterium]